MDVISKASEWLKEVNRKKTDAFSDSLFLRLAHEKFPVRQDSLNNQTNFTTIEDEFNGENLNVSFKGTGFCLLPQQTEYLKENSEEPALGTVKNLISPSFSSPTWLEIAGNVHREYKVEDIGPNSRLKVRKLRDERQIIQKLKDGFMTSFFPVGYPTSVSEGYGTYSKYRTVQHFVGGILGVLSTQSLLFAAGLRPTPAQATIVSWVLKDGMAHVGKLICSTLGARMDAEPKRWRIFADTMYDVGAGLEVLSPLCPQHFLAVAGMANMAKGMALVSARSTRLPIYTSFACDGNLSDLYAKGEAISVLCNMVGLALGIRLASTVCASTRGKLIAFPILSSIHLYCVATEMRAAPVNTLNAQRTAMLVADYLKRHTISFPGELRYREKLIFPGGLNRSAGSVRVGAPLKKAVAEPSKLLDAKRRFKGENFLLNFNGECTDLILHRRATGEDAIRGWLLAACAAEIAEKRNGSNSNSLSVEDESNCQKSTFQHKIPFLSSSEGGDKGEKFSFFRIHKPDKDTACGHMRELVLDEAYQRMEQIIPSFLEGLKAKGWHTHLFLEGSGVRAVW